MCPPYLLPVSDGPCGESRPPWGQTLDFSGISPSVCPDVPWQVMVDLKVTESLPPPPPQCLFGAAASEVQLGMRLACTSSFVYPLSLGDFSTVPVSKPRFLLFSHCPLHLSILKLPSSGFLLWCNSILSAFCPLLPLNSDDCCPQSQSGQWSPTFSLDGFPENSEFPTPHFSLFC